NDLAINTACWRRYRAIGNRAAVVPRDQERAEWRELCELWSSDYRTHITEARWHAYLERLRAVAGDAVKTGPDWNVDGPAGDRLETMLPGSPAIQWNGPLLTIRTE